MANKKGRRLVSAAIKSTGQKGFYETERELRGKPGVRSPKRLAGWLKGQAKKRGQLSPEHQYGKRKKK